MSIKNRRDFLRDLAIASGGVVLVPKVTACSGSSQQSNQAMTESGAPFPVSLDEIPQTKPNKWDPIAYNRIRGNAGAIPASYLDDINGPHGEKQHLGKHLPYLPEIDVSTVPDGYLALMWGDPDLDYTRHPNAVPNENNDYEGHWFNWIRIRKATSEEAIELESEYTGWPGTNPDDSGSYAVFGDGEITAESGKNTIYLAALPADVQSGDRIRVYAHCLTHGEYIDFIDI